MSITNGYATLEQVKASARVEDNFDDALLELAIEAASRQIDQACERVFYNQGTQARIFTPQSHYLCEIDDLISITKLETDPDGTTDFDIEFAAKDFQLEPLNGFAGGVERPFTHIRATDDYLFPMENGEALVRVTGEWGFASTPTAITQATVILASRIFKRNDSPLGVAGFGDIGVIRVGKMDPDVESLINAWKKPRM
ncbi:MAG TPA: head-tail connector protein [Candidatus Paceibacterota bacterium]|nr:head-tail connector protein [Candidatus Paceibacterota bacterium]